MVKGYPFVYVEWEDSLTPGNAWHDIEEERERAERYVKDRPLCQTAGFLIADTETVLTVAASLDQWLSACGGVIVIPQSAVRARWVLVEVKR